MQDRILKIIESMDMARSVTREQLFRGLVSILGSALADKSDSELEAAVKKVLPPFGKLRPPGSSGQLEFFFSCKGPSGCRLCGDACEIATGSKHVIRFVDLNDEWWGGTPYVEPSKSACMLCEGFPCAEACPAGSLKVPASIQAVSLGKAVVDMARCPAGPDNQCRACVDACPEPIHALIVERNGWITVAKYLCVGCGQCVEACPEEPSAIVIRAWGV
jgi:ferredoxin-type protein NapG